MCCKLSYLSLIANKVFVAPSLAAEVGHVRAEPELVRNHGQNAATYCKPWQNATKYVNMASANIHKGGLTIIPTTYISTIHLKQGKTVEMGTGKSLMFSELSKRRLLKC